MPGSPLAGRDAGLDDWAKTQDKVLVGAQTGEGGSYDLWTIELANPSPPFQLTSTLGMTEHDASFSPDDSRISFICGLSGGLWVMNCDGSGTKQIATPSGDVVLFWHSNWRRNP